jgi:hypothetical protein
MRQYRSSGSVEGVMGNHDSYSDSLFCGPQPRFKESLPALNIRPVRIENVSVRSRTIQEVRGKQTAFLAVSNKRISGRLFWSFGRARI